MKTVPIFIVTKSFPPRCPRCEHELRTQDDFAEYLGNQGTSSVDGRMRQMQRFPELFEVEGAGSGTPSAKNKFATDFIICRNCDNVTLRIEYGTQRVMTREEAEGLLNQGFTSWTEGIAFGTQAQPMQTLSLLGLADLNRLQVAVQEGRQKASRQRRVAAAGDEFAHAVEPALVEIMHKVRAARVTHGARDRLQATFAGLWQSLGEECQGLLLTAEVLRDELSGLAETDSSIDFSAAVVAYSKALENDLLDKLFSGFRRASSVGELPSATGRAELDRSLDALQAFVEGQRSMTLGDMAFCLRNVGCRMRHVKPNGFAQYLASRLSSIDIFCDGYGFPQRLMKYVQEYRNKSAHVSRLSKDECMAARAYLLEEPVQLLVALEEMTASPP